MRGKAVATGALALLAGLACGDEGPTDVGGDLIGSGIITFETVLDASVFLLEDTTYDGLGGNTNPSFTLVANDFEGTLNAHGLFRMTLPDQVTWQDTAGVSHQDSITAFRGAELTLVVDTLSASGSPIQLEVRPLLEEWDALTASWEFRADTSATAEPWATPGGTTGGVAGEAAWTAGQDTVVVQFDSAAAAVWTDSLGALRGGLVRLATAGARLRISSMQFRYLVEPESSTDTLVQAGAVAWTRFIVDDEVPDPAPGVLRVGGLPVWRSLLRFRPLETVVVPPDEVPECQVALSRTTVNLATLLLDPLPTGPHRIETPARYVARTVLEAPLVPLTRSPLGGVTPEDVMVTTLAPDRFSSAPVDPGPVGITVTPIIRSLLSGQTTEEPLEWLALTAFPEGAAFGYAEFGGLASASPPRLRLLLSVPANAPGVCP